MGNKGIIISGGGQLTAGQMAVGDHASVTVTNTTAQPEQLVRDLEEIRRLLEASKALQPDQRTALQQQVEVVETQSKAARPDKSVITSALATIELAAPVVTGLATIVKGVRAVFGV